MATLQIGSDNSSMRTCRALIPFNCDPDRSEVDSSRVNTEVGGRYVSLEDLD